MRAFGLALLTVIVFVAASLPTSITAVPDAVDWVAAGVVAPVSNEGQQEISWAIAAVETIEASVAIAGGAALVPLSVQQLVDCASWSGLTRYTITHGLCAAADYSAPAGACGDTSCKPAVSIASWIAVVANSDTALGAAVARQPVYAAVASSSTAFLTYVGGVLTSPACGTQVNHYVTIVGYNSSAPIPSWTAQNCWSAAWGEAGRIRLGRGAAYGPSGECGILVQPMYPVAHAVARVSDDA